MKCGTTDCGHPGTHKIKGRFWAKGYPHDHRFAEMELMNALFCEPCAKVFVAAGIAETFPPESQARIVGAFRAMRRPEPDLDTAELFAEALIAGEVAGRA